MSAHRSLFIAALVTLSASLSQADHRDLVQATAAMDLDRARSLALQSIAMDPTSPEAVAAAAWWLDHLPSLTEPGEILDRTANPMDPELGFILARIAAEIHGGAPEGVLTNLELAGPWGTFGLLELHRAAAPTDDRLPAPNTPWGGLETPYRVPVRSLDGSAAVPQQMQFGGVVTVLSTIRLNALFDGFLVVEGRGSLRLEVDGDRVADLSFAGLHDPEITWYRVRLEAGIHRIRVSMAPVDVATVRLSLIAGDGRPFDPEPGDEQATGGWAEGRVAPDEPPATATLSTPTSANLDELFLHVATARLRGDPAATRRPSGRSCGPKPGCRCTTSRPPSSISSPRPGRPRKWTIGPRGTTCAPRPTSRCSGSWPTTWRCVRTARTTPMRCWMS
jgi:hypothetical protein